MQWRYCSLALSHQYVANLMSYYTNTTVTNLQHIYGKLQSELGGYLLTLVDDTNQSRPLRAVSQRYLDTTETCIAWLAAVWGKKKRLKSCVKLLEEKWICFLRMKSFSPLISHIWNTSLKMTRPCFDCWWLDDIIHQRPFILTWINFKPSEAWISYYIHHKVWHEIAYPFLNFNGTKDK